MFRAAEFRDVVSGRRRGPVSSLLRGLLGLAEAPYTWAVRARNHAYDAGRRTVHRIDVPVVSVGNLTLGGTGKTPLVAWIARWLRDRNLRVALVSRGYKAAPGARNDEAQELAQRLPDVPHLQHPDRVAAAQSAIERFGAQVILLDDGFQHRRIARDLDIVLIDALEPFGYDHVFPRGTLREPLEGLARAQVVGLSRADLIDEDERARIKGVVSRHAPQAQWMECRHAPRRLLSAAGAEFALGEIAGGRVAAVCGIGNPAAFRRTLERCGCEVVAWREFPDHYAYGPADLEALNGWAAKHNVNTIVCTQKDLVKIGLEALRGKPLRAVCVEIEILAGGEALQQRLDAIRTACVKRPAWPGAAA